MKRNTAIGIGVAVLAAILAIYFFTRGGGDKADGKTVAAKTTGKKHGKTRVRRRSSTAGDDFRSSVLKEDDPEGKLRLEGRVVNSAGDGVGGAKVTIDSVPPRTVKTEVDGSFGIDKLVPRPYRLIARADQGVAGPVVARLNEKNDPVILRLKEAASVQFTVLSALDRSPIAGATVELRGMDRQTAQTNAKGIAVVKNVVPGWYNAVAYSPKYAKQHTWFRVSGRYEVTLELRKGAAVSGTVLTPEGKPLANASVIYQGASSWSQQAHPRWDAATIDAKGKFKFQALQAGSFRFVARHKDYAPGETKMIVLDGANERDNVEIKMEPPASLFGTVASKDGEPVPSARVRVLVRVEGMDWSRPRQVYADDKGKYEIGGLPRRQLQLMALHESGSSEVVDVDMTTAPFRRAQDITLKLTLTISGRVVSSNGDPVEGAQVTARPAERRRGPPRGSWRVCGRNTEITNANGEFTIGKLSKGNYQLRASPPGADTGWGSLNRYRKPVESKAGADNVEIVLEADAGVKGKVAFKNGDVPPVFTVGVGFGRRTPFNTKDGSFSLKGMPPNDGYTLTIRGPFDTVSQKVKVKAGEMKDLGTITVYKGRTISGVVTYQGQRIANASVRAGSMIFGDGSSSKAGFTPPFARGTKETTTDEDGVFVIYGAVLGDVSLVAEHEAYGRSRSYAVRKTQQSLNNLTLELLPFGALEGRVTRGGQPVQKVFVSAQSQSVPGARFGVQTDDDGRFRLDRLAPDRYQVTAMDMGGGGGMRGGMGSYSSVAVVESGKTTTTEIKFDGGDLVLKVKPVVSSGEPVRFAFVRAVGGRINVKTSRQLDLAIASMPGGYSGMGMSFMGMASTLKGLAAGTYTACAVPFPKELKGMQDGFAYMEREGANLPAYCKTVALTADKKESSIEIPVQIPTYVPPPEQK